MRHLSNRIPYYRLQDVLRGHPSLRAIGRITPLQSVACVRLTSWGDDKRRAWPVLAEYIRPNE